MNIYDLRRYGAVAFMAVAAAAIVFFLYYSNSLAKEVSAQERERMQVWADATREIARSAPDASGESETARLNFLLGIIKSNRTIPLILTDDSGNILDHRNFALPEATDSRQPLFISDANKEFLRRKLSQLRKTPNVIHIEIAPGISQHIYYEDSRLLRNLSMFPYVAVGIMLVFATVAYFAIRAGRRAEQNRLWTGLSKETAHQLGTPISSLMAWVEIMRAQGADKEMVSEMDKDIDRLTTVASRFSKIGSRPKMTPGDPGAAVRHAAEYMRARISRGIALELEVTSEPLVAEMSEPLIEWVMECLIKNAVDATEGAGTIAVSVRKENGHAAVYVTDTGRGMSRKTKKNVFRPGFTTKQRGWGLGLPLARRIIEQYHSGKIQIVSSEPDAGTTFRFTLPLISSTDETAFRNRP